MGCKYTQGVCDDGAAILKDGAQITVDEVLDSLNDVAYKVVDRAYQNEYQKIIDGLEQKLKNQHDSYNITIRKLSDKSCMRGARMQLMKEFMGRNIDYVTGEYVWEAFCHVNPEHADWFNDDGVPK